MWLLIIETTQAMAVDAEYQSHRQFFSLISTTLHPDKLELISSIIYPHILKCCLIIYKDKYIKLVPADFFFSTNTVKHVIKLYVIWLSKYSKIKESIQTRITFKCLQINLNHITHSSKQIKCNKLFTTFHSLCLWTYIKKDKIWYQRLKLDSCVLFTAL